jgi:hypothetical protein
MTAFLPNEAGEIMIIGYHDIGQPESKWVRTPDNFEQDLRFLYENDYFPIPLLDYVHIRIKAPVGKTPVIITFDDSWPGQFGFIKKGARLTVDPASALGIMEEFERTHSGFLSCATFFVVPDPSLEYCLFGQPEWRRDKLKYLIEHGHEIGNHSYSHRNLRECSDLEVQKELAGATAAIEKYLTGYRLKTLGLPFGKYPKNEALARKGSFDGESYEHEAVLYCGSGTAPSPITKKFDPLHLWRIQAGESRSRTAKYFKNFAKNPQKRYISGGDPDVFTIPRKYRRKINYQALDNKKINFY